jgi:glycosyltransferase involved in cell wall biosynthesis
MKKKIAIITAAYNTEPELIHNHFWSIAKQSSILDETIHIIVDDCSTRNETREALFFGAERNKDRTILISKDKNEGPGAARNRAVQLIEKIGSIEYICVLDSDDYFENDALLFRKTSLDANKNLIAVYGDKFTAKWEMREDPFDNGKNHLTEVSKTLEVSPQFSKQKLLQECYIPSCSIMFRAEPFLKYINSFREDVRLCEDWLVWRKLSMLGEINKISCPIYTQTLHGKNLTMSQDVLKNHWRDMVITHNDLKDWMIINHDNITNN